MERRRILIADNNPQEVQDLRKSLVASGYEVKIVDNGVDALNICREFRPHLVLSEVKLPKIDGHHLLRELKSQTTTKSIPFILMSRHRAVEERVHSINLGVDDYISKPFDINDVLLHFEIILKEIEKFESTPKNHTKGFSGKLSEMNLIELLQTMEIGKKTGVVKLQNDSKEGIVFLKDGVILDVSLDDLEPKDALYRLFTWGEGTFRVEIKEINRTKVLKESMGDLIYQGLIRRDRWERLSKRLPPLQAVIKQGPKLNENNLTNEERSLIRLINGKMRLIDLIELSKCDDLKALQIVSDLFVRGSIMEVPLEEDINNGNSSGQESQHYTDTNETRFAKLIVNFLSNPEEPFTTHKKERRRGERRRSLDRRNRSRRWSDYVNEKNKVYLNKSELLMIREKLSQDLKAKEAIDNLF
ncbi:MAG: response regulator [bacterium]